MKVTRNTDMFITQANQKFAQANKNISEGKLKEAYNLFREVKDVMDHAFIQSKGIQYQVLACEALKGMMILELRRGRCEEAMNKIQDALKRLESIRSEKTEKGLMFYFGEMYFHRSETYTIMSAGTKENELRETYLNHAIADADKSIEYIMQTEGYGTKIGCLRMLQGSNQQKGNAYAILQKHQEAAESFKSALDYCASIISIQPGSNYTAVRAGNSMRLALEMASYNADRSEVIAYANKGLAEYSEIYQKNKTPQNAYNLSAGCYNMALITEKFEDYTSAKNYCDKAISCQSSVCEADKYRVASVYRLLVYFDTILRVMGKFEIPADVVEKYNKDFETVKEIYTKVTGGAEFKRLNEQ